MKLFHLQKHNFSTSKTNPNNHTTSLANLHPYLIRPQIFFIKQPIGNILFRTSKSFAKENNVKPWSYPKFTLNPRNPYKLINQLQYSSPHFRYTNVTLPEQDVIIASALIPTRRIQLNHLEKILTLFVFHRYPGKTFNNLDLVPRFIQIPNIEKLWKLRLLPKVKNFF